MNYKYVSIVLCSTKTEFEFSDGAPCHDSCKWGKIFDILSWKRTIPNRDETLLFCKNIFLSILSNSNTWQEFLFEKREQVDNIFWYSNIKKTALAK